jgi:hypothetical protein
MDVILSTLEAAPVPDVVNVAHLSLTVGGKGAEMVDGELAVLQAKTMEGK